MDRVLLFMDYQAVFMDYQEDGNGLWTISKGTMFYGLQYNEGILQRKSFTLFYIFYIIT